MRTILLVAALAQLACATGDESASGTDSSGPGSGGSGGGTGSAGGETGGAAPAPYIHFTVVGAVDEEQTWAPPANQVECLGASALLLQFALDADAAAEQPRMEVSVVDYSGPATFTGADCVGPGCPPQPPGTFGLSYWPSGGASPIYRNGSTSMPCTLELEEPADGSLAGNWSCQALEEVVAGGDAIGMTADFACDHPAQ